MKKVTPVFWKTKEKNAFPGTELKLNDERKAERPGGRVQETWEAKSRKYRRSKEVRPRQNYQDMKESVPEMKKWIGKSQIGSINE